MIQHGLHLILTFHYKDAPFLVKRTETIWHDSLRKIHWNDSFVWVLCATITTKYSDGVFSLHRILVGIIYSWIRMHYIIKWRKMLSLEMPSWFHLAEVLFWKHVNVNILPFTDTKLEFVWIVFVLRNVMRFLCINTVCSSFAMRHCSLWMRLIAKDVQLYSCVCLWNNKITINPSSNLFRCFLHAPTLQLGYLFFCGVFFSFCVSLQCVFLIYFYFMSLSFQHILLLISFFCQCSLLFYCVFYTWMRWNADSFIYYGFYFSIRFLSVVHFLAFFHFHCVAPEP